MVPRITAFADVQVAVSTNGASVTVSWTLASGFPRDAGTFGFYVERARRGGSFTRLNPSAPVTATGSYSTTPSGELSETDLDYYRVVLETTTYGNFTSWPATAGYHLSVTDRRLIKNLVREKTRQMSRRLTNALSGVLLMRREVGTHCPACFDDALQAPTNSDCTTCYGTGITGGYYAYGPFWIEMAEYTAMRVTELDAGNMYKRLVGARCICYPLVTPDDVFVAPASGARYKLGAQVKVEVWVRDIPIISVVQLEKLPLDDIIYQVPITETCFTTGTADWNTGISAAP